MLAQNCYMTEITDPFLIRLKAVIDADPELTPAGLAKRANMSASSIRMMFTRGTMSPSLDSARKICEALGTTVEEFMSEDRSPEEREIARLVKELPEPLRQQLLGYGRALADTLDRETRGSREEPE